jgi:hypothetical protein
VGDRERLSASCICTPVRFMYWFNLGQGKTAHQHMHTHTARERILVWRPHRTRSQAKCFKSGSCAVCRQFAAQQFILLRYTYTHTLQQFYVPRWIYRVERFSIYNVLQKAHNERRSCDVARRRRLAWSEITRLNLYVEGNCRLHAWDYDISVDEDKGMMACVICISQLCTRNLLQY